MPTAGRQDIRALVEGHYAELYRYAYRLSGSVADAEDLTQETFCTAQAKLGQLERADAARAWLYKILRHHYLRGFRTRRFIPCDSLAELPDPCEAEGELPEEFDGERLGRALGELSPVFREPLVLFYFEELSYRQIAEALGVPLGTVMSRLARGKAHLRSRLRPAPAVHRLTPAPPGVG